MLVGERYGPQRPTPTIPLRNKEAQAMKLRITALLLLVAAVLMPACETNSSGSAETSDGDMETDAAETENILAMTFNLRNGMATDGANAWSNRKALVTEVIESQKPAILGVQEAWKFQVEHIQSTVPGYAWVGVSRQNIEGLDEYSAVFFRKDRFALIDSGTFWLSETPDTPSSKFSDAQSTARIVTWAGLESRQSGQTFFVFNTHFDTSNEDFIKERSAALLVRRIASIAQNHPALVMGDFNDIVGSSAYRILTGAMTYEGVSGHLIDPWVVLGLPEEGTYHGFTGTASAKSRIDWLLATQEFQALSGSVLHDEKDGRYPSDHFPSIASFSWKTE